LPRQRFVLLGASNLKRSFSYAITVAAEYWKAPHDFHVAMGHGRSYGQESYFFGNFFSGIFQCDLWKQLESSKHLPTVALLMDIGNDLAYGAPVSMIMKWVRGCSERLLNMDAQIVVSELPMEVLRNVSSPKFRLFRALLFPSCRLSWSELLYRAERLNESLLDWAESKKTPIFSGENAWYGFDPIHPRRRHFREMWHGIYSRFESERSHLPLSGARENQWLLRWYLRCLSPPSLGRSLRSESINLRTSLLHDGTRITLY